MATWLAFFPRNQLLVLRQEDLIAAPIESYANATAFLGIPPLSTSAILVHGRGGVGSNGKLCLTESCRVCVVSTQTRVAQLVN